MWFNKNTHANVKNWTEYRTPSGRWSKIKHDMEEMQFNSLQLQYFFDWHPRGQRITRTYFREGYLPWRVTVPSPDGTMRHVYVFNYRTEEAR